MSHEPDVVPASLPCPVRQLLLYPALHRDPQNQRVVEPNTIDAVMLSLLETQTLMSARKRAALQSACTSTETQVAFVLSTRFSLADR